MKNVKLSPLAQAFKDHDEKEISLLSSQGETLLSNENPVVLMASGFNGNDLDQFHTQDEKRIGKVVQAAVQSGVDVNAPVEGEPASHYLTREYVSRQMGAEYDTSYAASIGMKENNYMGMLKAYAENGVDFRTRNDEGRSFVEVGRAQARSYAEKHHPETVKPDYSPEHDFASPSFQRVEKEIGASLDDIKIRVRQNTIKDRAQSQAPQPSVSKVKKQDER